jgi:cell filamentation protein
LKNKAGLHAQSALDAFEADTTAIRLLELSEYPIPGKFDLPHLQAIHRHLFQDVYDWAGQLRTVDISKRQPLRQLRHDESYLGQNFKIAGENFLIAQAPEAFIRKLAHYMGEINAAHPSGKATAGSSARSAHN